MKKGVFALCVAICAGCIALSAMGHGKAIEKKDQPAKMVEPLKIVSTHQPKELEVARKQTDTATIQPEKQYSEAQPDENPVPTNSLEKKECQSDIETLAKLVWGEARGCSKTEQAAVIWCVLNRVDSPEKWFPDTICEVVTQKNQFTGYRASNPIEDQFVKLAEDVVDRWEREKDGEKDSGRVLPKEYLYFHGDGAQNLFRTDYKDKSSFWDWSLESPY